MPESDQLGGNHRYIDKRHAVVDSVFKIIHDEAVANGGTLSAKDILRLEADLRRFLIAADYS